MVEIEYDNVKVSVPENWEDINLGLYEKISTQRPTTKREEVSIVAEVCKIDVETLFKWPAEVFNEIIEYIDFLFKDNPALPNPEIEICGVKYVVPIEEDLPLGAWVDADEVQKNSENTLSNVLAIVCRPIGEDYNHKNNETRAAMFAEQPVSKILGVLAFFLQCKAVLNQRTAAYTNLLALIDQLPRSIRPFRSLGGGIRLSQIWPTIKYYSSTVLLYYQLQKFSRSFNTKKIRTTRKKPNIN